MQINQFVTNLLFILLAHDKYTLYFYRELQNKLVMKAKMNFRSVVFKRAYILVKQTGCSFSEALTQAWEKYRAFKTKTVDELTASINGFDFCFQYSDDSRVYRYWSKLQKEIREQIQSLPGSFISAIANHFQANQIKSFI